ncbi:hypothetical protein [Changpingibacter yushuensis]|uniref:hypothetical protein n=1 Tax=Changpingibacter yushuensis TaxID=2758440 RepID=UPI0015F77471|nr:hypothetical protein [Changpingibacter yushuensis]
MICFLLFRTAPRGTDSADDSTLGIERSAHVLLTYRRIAKVASGNVPDPLL